MEVEPEAASEDAFVGCHPLDAEAVGDGDGFVGDTAFGGPESDGTRTKGLFMQVETAGDLLAGVIGTAEAGARQR